MPAREVVLSWGETSTNFDWLGELQTTPRKTLKSFVKYLPVFAGISIISISISPAHQRREMNLWQHKKKHWSGVVMRRCRRSGDLLARLSGDFRPGTSGGSIRREVVYGLSVNPKQKKKKK